MWIGGLGVVDPGDVIALVDGLDAVSAQVQVLQSLGRCLRAHPEGPGERSSGQGILHIVRGSRLDVGHLGQWQGRAVPFGDEGSVDDYVVHHTDHRETGDPVAKADGSSTLDDVGLLHHLLSGRVVVVVDAGVRHLVEDARLVGTVGCVGVVGMGVPLQMVLVQVEHGC